MRGVEGTRTPNRRFTARGSGGRRIRPTGTAARWVLRGVSFMVGHVAETPKAVTHETAHRFTCCVEVRATIGTLFKVSCVIRRSALVKRSSRPQGISDTRRPGSGVEGALVGHSASIGA